MRAVLRAIVTLFVILGAMLAVAGAAPWVRSRIAIAQASSKDPAVRKRGLSYLRDERDARGLDVVLRTLAREVDPDLTELAGYTAMRTRDPQAAAALQARADREQDAPLRARLILYAARLADGDLRLQPWLQESLHTNEPWRQVGSAAGLLQLGRVEGGAALVELADSLSGEPAGFALAELHRVAEVMAEAVGYPLTAANSSGSDRQLSLRAFWARYGTPRLLCDALARLDRSDAAWHEVDRLMHARERVSRWLN